MKALEQFEEAAKALALEFMKLKEGDEWEGNEYLPNDCYFIGYDFGTFSDGSDYYTWDLNTMYSILKNKIPYEIATEHFDWHNDDYSKPEGWINLEHYATKRKDKPRLPTEDFQRMLERQYHESRAYSLTNKAVEEERKAIEAIKEKYLGD